MKNLINQRPGLFLLICVCIISMGCGTFIYIETLNNMALGLCFGLPFFVISFYGLGYFITGGYE